MKKVVVIGGSSGAIPVLCGILKSLPADFAAPVLAVIHTTQESQFLPKVLGRCDQLEVVSPKFAEPIAAGCVYVAAPNRHLIVKSHCAISWMGPRENRHRPSVDVLFRSAARIYRSHVIAVVLSGALDDGSAGALAVKARGGKVIVQDPKESAVEDMPANVLRAVKADFCLPPEKISAQLVEEISKGREIKFRKPSPHECTALSENPFSEVEPQGLTCPDCGGVVTAIKNGGVTQFRCHVGHKFSLESFSEAHADALERALWIALRKLNEQRSIQESLAKGELGPARMRKRHQENADAAKRDMQLLHEILGRL